jgi:hypothetical protein
VAAMQSRKPERLCAKRIVARKLADAATTTQFD